MHVEVIFDAAGQYAIAYKGRTIAPGLGPLPAPPVLFLGSLAACAGVFAVEYLRTRGLPFEGLRITAEAEHAEEPRRLASCRVQVILPSSVEARHLAPLGRAVDLCTLKNTLVHPPAVRTEVLSRAPAGAVS
jgi:putative redox protein